MVLCIYLLKAMVFPVVMYGCESWTIKKAECRRIDTFELWYWRRKWQPTPVLLPGESHGRLQSMGSQGVGHDGATSLFTFTFIG